MKYLNLHLPSRTTNVSKLLYYVLILSLFDTSDHLLCRTSYPWTLFFVTPGFLMYFSPADWHTMTAMCWHAANHQSIYQRPYILYGFCFVSLSEPEHCESCQILVANMNISYRSKVVWKNNLKNCVLCDVYSIVYILCFWFQVLSLCIIQLLGEGSKTLGYVWSTNTVIKVSFTCALPLALQSIATPAITVKPINQYSHLTLWRYTFFFL